MWCTLYEQDPEVDHVAKVVELRRQDEPQSSLPPVLINHHGHGQLVMVIMKTLGKIPD